MASAPRLFHDKVVAIADISIYTNDDEERPLVKVLETIRDKNDSKPVDVKGLGSDADLRKYFETILPEFDKEESIPTTSAKYSTGTTVLSQQASPTSLCPNRKEPAKRTLTKKHNPHSKGHDRTGRCGV